MTGIGHNRGPSLEPGRSWRRQCWQTARAALLPTLPIEVVRLRVSRARELGLDYKTYAGLRATTGHDIVAFLFSTNALNLLRATDRIEAARLARLAALTDAGRLVAVHAPLDPDGVARMLAAGGAPIRAAGPAPRITESWSATRARIARIAAAASCPPDRIVLIGETAGERDWVAAGRLAGFVAAARYFPPGAQVL